MVAGICKHQRVLRGIKVMRLTSIRVSLHNQALSVRLPMLAEPVLLRSRLWFLLPSTGFALRLLLSRLDSLFPVDVVGALAGVS